MAEESGFKWCYRIPFSGEVWSLINVGDGEVTVTIRRATICGDLWWQVFLRGGSIGVFETLDAAKRRALACFPSNLHPPLGQIGVS